MVPCALVHRAHAETHHWAPSSSAAVSTVSASPASCGAGGAAATSCIAGAGAGGRANRWVGAVAAGCTVPSNPFGGDRKSTRLNSSHGYISYAVFCLKKKKKKKNSKVLTMKL